MLISNGSERGRFQRTYKNNGSGAGEKLKRTFYCGNSLIFLEKLNSRWRRRDLGGYRGVLYLDCFEYKLLADFNRLLHALRPGGLGGYEYCFC